MPQYEASAEVASEVCAVVRAALQLGSDPDLDAGTVLLEDGLALDSVAVLELLLALERRFQIAIEENEVTEEALHTIGSLTALIVQKLAAPRGDDV